MNFEIKCITHGWFYPNLTLSLSCATFFLVAKIWCGCWFTQGHTNAIPFANLFLVRFSNLPSFTPLPILQVYLLLATNSPPTMYYPNHENLLALPISYSQMKTQETSHHCTIVGKTLDLTWNQMCLVIVVDLTTLGYFYNKKWII